MGLQALRVRDSAREDGRPRSHPRVQGPRGRDEGHLESERPRGPAIQLDLEPLPRPRPAVRIPLLALCLTRRREARARWADASRCDRVGPAPAGEGLASRVQEVDLMDFFTYTVFWGALFYGWVIFLRYLLRKERAEWRMDRAEREAKREAVKRAASIGDEAEEFLKGEK